jgi:hypothetical protein
MLIRFVVLAFLILLVPLVLILPVRSRRRVAFDALHARSREIWGSSPADAIALLRSIFDQLVRRCVDTKMTALEIAPFGRFETGDLLALRGFLYECELAVGDIEGALSVAAALPWRIDDWILQQVDCLVALNRKDDAIVLLERNLDLDGWRGKLRRRLAELGGHLRALN